MRQYHDLLNKVMQEGILRGDRTGTGTKSLFAQSMRFDLRDGFPLVTSKAVDFSSIVHELIWFLKGDTNIRYLAQNGVHIWDDWPYKSYLTRTGQVILSTLSAEWKSGKKQFSQRIATDDEFATQYGDLGPVYGSQWRKWPAPDGSSIDQIALLIEQLMESPSSRRMVVSAWNVAEIDHMTISGLPPCHMSFQLYAADDVLNMHMMQRSGDLFLGLPYNIASYALLLKMIAQVCGFTPGELVITIADAHIYTNHMDQVALQLTRTPKPLPVVELNPLITSIDDFSFDDVELVGYKPDARISAPVAV